MAEEGNTTKPNDEVLLDNIGKIAYTLDRAYMPRLESDYGVLYFDEKYNQDGALSYSSNVRAVKVDKWLFDREQEPGECFKNVLSTFADGDHTIALVVKRTPSNTEMYFVVKNEGKGREEESRDNVELLNAAIRGNFPGSHTEIIEDANVLETLFDNNKIVEVDGKPVKQVNSVFKTHSINIGANGGLNKSHTDSEISDKRGATKVAFEAGGGIVGGIAGFFVGGPAGVVAGAGTGAKIGGKAGQAASAFQKVKSKSDTKGSSIGGSFGYGYSWGASKAITNSTANTEGRYGIYFQGRYQPYFAFGFTEEIVNGSRLASES